MVLSGFSTHILRVHSPTCIAYPRVGTYTYTMSQSPLTWILGSVSYFETWDTMQMFHDTQDNIQVWGVIWYVWCMHVAWYVCIIHFGQQTLLIHTQQLLGIEGMIKEQTFGAACPSELFWYTANNIQVWQLWFFDLSGSIDMNKTFWQNSDTSL